VPADIIRFSSPFRCSRTTTAFDQVSPARSITARLIPDGLLLAEWSSTSTFPMRYSTFNAATDPSEFQFGREHPG
jgi:hypothetical protein